MCSSLTEVWEFQILKNIGIPEIQKYGISEIMEFHFGKKKNSRKCCTFGNHFCSFTVILLNVISAWQISGFFFLLVP